MYTTFYQASEYLTLAQWGGVFFAVFFTGVVAWILFDKRTDFDAVARLPLAHDEEPVLDPAANQR